MLAGLGLVFQVGRISPNYGKPVVTGDIESGAFIAEMIIWATGEVEFVDARKTDGWNLNKHYDLASSEDLEVALAELVVLIAGESGPGQGLRHGTRAR